MTIADVPQTAPATLVTEATDLGSAHHLLTGMYGTLRIEPHGPQHGVRIAQTPLGPARLDNVRFAMHFDAQGDPPGMLYVGHLLSGALTVGTGHDWRAYQPGDVLLAAQPDNPYTATIRDTGIDLAGIPPDLLAQVADTGPDRKQQPLSLTGHEPVSGKAAASWKATYAYARQLAQDPATAGQPLVAASAARLLAAVTLATFPSNALTEPTAADRHDASPAMLQRAVAFIDEHARQDITVADIAASAFVTIRAVQLAFRRHLDTTPTAYLRQVRLDHAHHDLAAADPALETVTAVALRWGFPSPSRFTAAYHREYGVTPSLTLHHN